ncbi:MAG TPA: acetyl-CoA carboxylase biotin carboxyl carrier protein [Nitrospirota bacterium]|nr:acetyl-CoA carboxylase biotin carboxyl carrier protein [Nitrospirota bacterium]
MNLKEIKELIDMLKDTDISEIEIERSGVKVRLRKGGDVTFHPAMPRLEYPPTAIIAPAVSDAPVAAVPQEKQPVPAESSQIKVTAPIVGTFYRSSSPDKPAYVEVGDVVKKGQVLCIIEAMKLMNEIESETPGKIVKIMLENGQPVEYGQPLFVIEPV